MLLYTIMPIEQVMDPGHQAAPLREIRVDGVLVLADAAGGGMNRIVRVVSTDPQVYLDPRLTPGTMVPSR